MVAGNDIRVLVLLHHLRFFVLVANFANDLFDQIFNGDEARDSSVLIDDNRHAYVAALHFAQQVAHQFTFRHKVNVLAHQRRDRPRPRLRVRNLQHILRMADNALECCESKPSYTGMRENGLRPAADSTICFTRE